MDKVLYPLVAVLAAIALAYKIPALRRDPRSPTRRALVAMLACLVWAPAVNTPAVYLAFDRLTGVANLARLIAHFGIIGTAASVQILLLHWTVRQPGPMRTWIRLVPVAVAVLAMTVFFTLAPVDVSTTEFTVRYGDAPYIAEYMVVYLGYFALALIDIMRLSWRYAGLTRRPFVRVGLLLVTAGAVFGIAYCVEKAAYIAASQAGFALVSPALQEAVSPVLSAGGAIFMLVGFTIPSWGPRLVSAGAWAGQYRTYQRLRPLWLAMYEATPEIALDPAAGGARRLIARDRVAVRDLEYRLVRRVVEIRDGWLALRPYLSQETAETARRMAERADLAGEKLTATVHAAVLAGARCAKARGEFPERRYVAEPAAGASATSGPGTYAAGTGLSTGAEAARSIDGVPPSDVARETAELVAISRALDSPIVRAALAAQEPAQVRHGAVA